MTNKKQSLEMLKRCKDIVEYLAFKNDLEEALNEWEAYKISSLENALEKSFSKPGSIERELNDTGVRYSRYNSEYRLHGIVSKILEKKENRKGYSLKAKVTKFDYDLNYYTSYREGHHSCCEQLPDCDCHSYSLQNTSEERSLQGLAIYKINLEIPFRIFNCKEYADYKRIITSLSKTADIKETEYNGGDDEFKQYLKTWEGNFEKKEKQNDK